MLARGNFGPLALLSLVAAVWLLPGCAHRASGDPGRVTFLIETMPSNLDPRIGTDAQSQRIHSLLFNGLVERDSRMNLHGDLAEGWETPEPLTYIFHLRRGVRFHNGRPLTAQDVKFTFDSILSGTIHTPKRGAFRMVAGIEAPDDATIVFKLKEPFASFLWNLARPSVGIVPAGIEAGFAQSPVGTGPFRFVSARQDEDVVLERNSAYFGQVPQISGVRFQIVPDATVRALELRKGTADLVLNSLAPDMIPVLARQPALDITDEPGTIYWYVAHNLEDPALSRREVRQALAYATDRESLIKYLLRGQARAADSLLPPSHWAHDAGVTQYAYNPAQAEQLLDAAGFYRGHAARGMRLRLTLKTSTEEIARLLGAVLQDQWRRVGVELDLRPLELATLYADMTRGDFQLYTLRWVGGNNDPDIFEYVFHSRKVPPNGANRGHYHNPSLDQLLDSARVEMNLERRRRIYGEVQRIVAEDQPYLNLWYSDNVCVHRKRVGEVRLTPSGDYDFLSGITLK